MRAGPGAGRRGDTGPCGSLRSPPSAPAASGAQSGPELMPDPPFLFSVLFEGRGVECGQTCRPRLLTLKSAAAGALGQGFHQTDPAAWGLFGGRKDLGHKARSGFRRVPRSGVGWASSPPPLAVGASRPPAPPHVSRGSAPAASPAQRRPFPPACSRRSAPGGAPGPACRGSSPPRLSAAAPGPAHPPLCKRRRRQRAMTQQRGRAGASAAGPAAR